MKERSFYIETSIWGMLPKGQPRDMRKPSVKFLRRLTSVNCFVSPIVMKELMRAGESDRLQILEVFERIEPTEIELTQEAEELAQHYIDSEVLPAKKGDDALHVAIATVAEMDVLVSWNHRHIANLRKTELYRAVNLLHGYSQTPLILTPLEVLEDE